jgi:hypothetical protein
MVSYNKYPAYLLWALGKKGRREMEVNNFDSYKNT